MENKEVKRFKRLKYADRIKIEELLNQDYSKDEIANQLHEQRFIARSQGLESHIVRRKHSVD